MFKKMLHIRNSTLRILVVFLTLSHPMNSWAQEYLSTPYKDIVLRYSRNVQHTAVLFAPLNINLHDWGVDLNTRNALKSCIGITNGTADKAMCESQLHPDAVPVLEEFREFLHRTCHYNTKKHQQNYNSIATLEHLAGLNRNTTDTNIIKVPYCHRAATKGYKIYTGYEVSKDFSTWSTWQAHVSKFGEGVTLEDADWSRENDINDILRKSIFRRNSQIENIQNPSLKNFYLINYAALEAKKEKIRQSNIILEEREKMIKREQEYFDRCVKTINGSFYHFRRSLKTGKCYGYLPRRDSIQTSEYFQNTNPAIFNRAAQQLSRELKFDPFAVKDDSFCGSINSDYDLKINDSFDDLIRSFHVNLTKAELETQNVSKSNVIVVEREISTQLAELTGSENSLASLGAMNSKITSSNSKSIHDLTILAQFLNDFSNFSFVNKYMNLQFKEVPGDNNQNLLNNAVNLSPQSSQLSIYSVSLQLDEKTLIEGPQGKESLFVVSAGNDRDAVASGGAHAGNLGSYIVVGGLNYNWEMPAPGATKRDSISIYAPACGARVYKAVEGKIASYTGLSDSGGTSLSTPFVSLTAGLVSYLKPDWNAEKVKQKIIESSDISKNLNILNMADAVSVFEDIVQTKDGKRFYGNVEWVGLNEDGTPINAPFSGAYFTCRFKGRPRSISTQNIVKWFTSTDYIRSADENVNTHCQIDHSAALRIVRKYDMSMGEIEIVQKIIPLDDVDYFYNARR